MRVACSMSAYKGSIDEALGNIAQMGLRYVDIIAIPGWNLVDVPALVSSYEATVGELEKGLKKHSLTPVAINAAIPHLYVRDKEETNVQRKNEAEALFKMMKNMEIPVISFFPGGNWPAQEMEWEDVLTGEKQTVAELLEIAGGYGVTATVEPHYNTPFQTLDQINRLLSECPELRIAYDPSHFAMQSIALADTLPFLARASHVHIRDAAPGKMQDAVGEGTVDFGWLIGELGSLGYDGAVSIEYLPGNEDQIPRMKEVLEKLV